ncbi:MAG: hypothetical protein D6689_07515 [Deltaproteobacteria bacterium]|nr:MAG: hypothetical protein D6689_07515 [Deltaproteobacteria bacterium]
MVHRWLCVGALTLVAATAAANGRFPATVGAYVHPTDPDTWLSPTTFGLLLTRDGGASFQWVCEDAIGYSGSYDPDYAVAADGAIFATTFDGLRVSRDGGCTFELVPGAPGDTFIGAVAIGPDGGVWAAAAGVDDGGVYRSADNGASFARTGLEVAGALWRRIEVAPSDAARAYVSGTVTGPDGTAVPLLYRTDDAGAAWQAVAIDGIAAGASLVDVLAVSPADADVVYVAVRRANPPNGDAVYRSDDAGGSWTRILDTTDTLSAFVARADGQRLVAGTRFDQDTVHVSADRGATWQVPPAQPVLACAAERPDGKLIGCGANWEPDFMAVGVSGDARSWQSVLEFRDLDGPLACQPGTVQFDTCTRLVWPDLAIKLGVGEAGDDAGAGTPDAAPAPDAGRAGGGGDCGCSAAVAAVVVVLPRRRRRRVTARR